jgi:metal transporter CNNM
MVSGSKPSTRLAYILLSLVAQYASRFFKGGDNNVPLLVKRSPEDPHSPQHVAFIVLIPVLVLLSGVFAGLTLGYMSLDETQLNVLKISGTPYVHAHASWF